MMKYSKLSHSLVVFPFMIAACFSGCSSALLVTPLGEVNDNRDSTVFLLNYELNYQTETKEDNACSVVLKHLDSDTLYSIPLNPDQRVVQVEAPFGHYQVKQFLCTKSKAWELDHWGIDGITAYPGKVNYLGHFSFQLSKDQDIHELTIQRGDRDQTRRNLTQSVQRRSEEWLNRVVSAYNGKLLSRSYLVDEKNYRREIVSHVVGKKVHLNHMNFDSCENTEFKMNPVPLGVLTYEAEYNKDRLVKLGRRTDTNTFTDSYMSCVENLLREFHPGFYGKVKYDVNF